MKLKQTTMSLAVGVALAAVTLASQAATITTYDGPTSGPFQTQGTFGPFGGFDWASNGSAVATGYTLVNAGDTSLTNLTFWASAANVVDPSQVALTNPGFGILADIYEYTVVAQLTETATCNAGAGYCTDASFDLVSGTWSIYYGALSAGAAPDANQLAGTGFTNGALILSGTFDPGFAGSFASANPTTGSGNNSLTGLVTYTNNTYINPNLLGTTVGTELKFGLARTDGGGLPTATPFEAIRCSLQTGTVCMQADANQSFTESVPEPASLALLGIGLIGLGFSRRKQQ
jgi:hypothetical protein